MDEKSKKIGLLFYTAGRFEGLRADAGSTIEFIKKDDGRVLQNKQDLSILRDMKEAWVAIEPGRELTSKDYISAHKAMIVSTNAIYPGELRTSPVRVSFGGGKRLWTADYEEVTEAMISEKIHEAIDIDAPAEVKAARAFFNIAKLQPFPDGNKRTAIIVANRMLLADDDVLLIPYKDEDYQKFMRALEGFDTGQLSLEEVSEWFATFVRNVNDLDVSMPFGEIIDLEVTTTEYNDPYLTNKKSNNLTF
jgi:Uncharacterized conserved protein